MNGRRRPRDWRIAEAGRGQVVELARALNVSPILAQVLIARGIHETAEARHFLNPSLANASDPHLLQDMDAAMSRIRHARDHHEHVTVFGDYDVDGLAGTVILLNALRRIGIEQCGWAVPHRLTEGFGIKPQHVRRAHEDGATLIVTVDNGTSSHEAAAEAERLGIDLVITDHHLLDGPPAKAVAVLNPKREGPSHPAANACGAAVAYKLACALTGEEHDVDLVALGTVADIVPLLGENRDLVAAGLAEMCERPRVGIEALAKAAGISTGALKAEQIAFQLGPRLNAAGRLGRAQEALDLLLEDSPAGAERIARRLNSANEERRRIENEILEDVEALLEEDPKEGRHSVVLGDRHWHAGVLGIVASRVQSRYNLPAVLIAFDEDGLGRGSGRGVEGLDLAGALGRCQDHLMSWGGHAAAAGLTVHEDRLVAFQEQFEAEVARALPGGAPAPGLSIDALVSLSEVDGRLVASLDKLQPFGCGNPAPVLCTCGVRVMPNSCRELRGGHVRLAVKEGPALLTVVGFGMGEHIEALRESGSIDIVYTPQFNTWRGETSIQLILKDFRTGAAD